MSNFLKARWNYKLLIQPTPKNNWGDSLAQLLPKEIWDVLRKEVYAKANYICEICLKYDRTLNCHEHWGYDDEKKIQYLIYPMCICTECHNSIHWFRTENAIRKREYPPSYIDVLKSHFISVNGIDIKKFGRYLTWTSYLRDYRIRYEYEIRYGRWEIANIISTFRSKEKWTHQ